MPPPYNQQQVLDSLRQQYPRLTNYRDEDVLAVYDRLEQRKQQFTPIEQRTTPTGLPSIAEEVPSYAPQHTEEYVGLGERFAKRAWEAAVPFGMYEPELPEAEGFSEQLAGAIGSGAGFVLGAVPISLLTGGVGIPIKAAQSVHYVSKILTAARAAEKAGKPFASLKATEKFLATMARAGTWEKGKFTPGGPLGQIDAAGVVGFIKAAPKGGLGNILGKSEMYRRGIQSIAARGPEYVKYAKAMDLGVRNFSTFALYGQTHMKPDSPLSLRWEQLQADAVTAGLFTGIGAAGTRIFSSNTTGGMRKSIQAGEYFGMFAAGAYMSDMGQEDIPFEERLAHGITLVLMHGITSGLDRVGAKQKAMNQFISMGDTPEVARQKVYGSKTVDNLYDSGMKFLKDSPNLFVDMEMLTQREPVSLGKPAKRKMMGDHLVHLVRSVDKPPATKDNPKAKPYVEFEHFSGKLEKGKEDIILKDDLPRRDRIYAESIEEAEIAFNKRFLSFKVAAPEQLPREQLKREPVPEGMKAEEIQELEIIGQEIKDLNLVKSSPPKKFVARGREFVDVPISETKGEIVPKIERIITRGDTLKNEIKDFQKRIAMKESALENIKDMHFSNRFLLDDLTNWNILSKKDLYKESLSSSKAGEKPANVSGLKKFKAALDKDKAHLADLQAQLREMNPVQMKRPASIEPAKYEVGEWARIPAYFGEGKFDKGQAGAGKYIGKYGELSAEVKETVDTRGLGKSSNFNTADVFETVIPAGPERLHRVAIRPRDVKPQIASELEPSIIRAPFENEIKIREKDATPATVSRDSKEALPPEYRNVSILDQETKNFRFSLPEKISGIKDASDLAKGTNRDVINIVKKLNKEGIKPEKFLSDLKKDGFAYIGTQKYIYGGVKELAPDFSSVEIRTNLIERYEGPAYKKDLITRENFTVVFPRKILPREYLRESEYKESVKLYDESQGSRGALPVEPASSIPAKMSASQRNKMWENIGVSKKTSEGPTFSNRAQADAWIKSASKKSYEKHVEFYIEPTTSLNARGKLRDAVKDEYRRSQNKGGRVFEAEQLKAKYEAGAVQEPGSFKGFSPSGGYNPEISTRLTDVFGINFGKPVRLKLFKYASDGGKRDPGGIHTKTGSIIDPNFSLGFDTYAEANAWAKRHWIGTKGDKTIEDLIQYKKDLVQADYTGSAQYKEYTDANVLARKTMNQYGVPIDYHLGGKKMSKRMRNILDTFYPEVKGDFNKLNTAELNKLTAMFSKDKDGNVIPSKVNMLPPDDIYIGELNPTWMKAVQWGNIPLPIYTILDAAGGRLSSNRMMAWSFLKRKTLNLMQTFSKAFTDKVPERYLEILQKEIDPLFKEARTGEHAKTVEKMKNKMIKVPVPEFDASGNVVSKTSIMSEYNYTKMLLQNLNDKIAMEKSRHRVEVQNSRIEGDRGKNDFLEVYGRVTDDKGKVVKKPDGSIETVRIDLKRVPDQDLIKILTGEHRKGSKIQVAGKEKLEPMVIDKVANNHYEPNYFYRMLTQEFFDLIQSDKDGLRGHVVNSIMKKNPTMSKAEAKKQLKIIEDLREKNAMDGQDFTRIAEIDPWIYYDKSTGSMITPRSVYNSEGQPFKVGDSIRNDLNKTQVVGRAVQTYSTNATEIVNRYGARSANAIASYGAYGGLKGISEARPSRGINIPKEREIMAKAIEKAGGTREDMRFFDELAKRVMEDHVKGRSYEYPLLGPKLGQKVEWLAHEATRTSAVIGLSFPISGVKNLGLGQVQLGLLSGRELLYSYYKLLTKPGEWKKAYDLAKEVGAVYSGTYDLFIKPATPLKLLYNKPKGVKEAAFGGWEMTQEMLLKAGMMRPTEMFNRIIASMMGPRIMEVHLDNLMGVKNFSTRGVSIGTSRRILGDDFMRFSDKEISDMIKRRKSGLKGWTDEQRLWSADRAHTMTQGVGDYPYIPYIMGRHGFKPMTLFYRIAYRMTDNISKQVIKPAVIDGNIWPMMKYVGLSLAAGEGLYSIYWYAFGEERRNKFKDAPANYWSNFVRAEGLGIFSNAFDEYGSSISDAYTPVVYRNFVSLTQEALHLMHGEKTRGEAFDSLMRKTVAFYSGSQRVYQHLSGSDVKRVKNSRRRQSQFLDVYFPQYDPVIESGDALTRNSPHYEAIRNIFWLEEPKDKAHEYYVALNYLTDVIQRDNVALAKNPMQAKKMAKARIKSIISRMRPIPSTWRDRKKGDKTTKYKLYMSKLSPEQIREELNIEKLYKEKKREFWRAVAQYR